jgi:hypothetical protein
MVLVLFRFYTKAVGKRGRYFVTKLYDLYHSARLGTSGPQWKILV